MSDKVIEWAREAGMTGLSTIDIGYLTSFATLARAEMKEQCAVAAWSKGMELHMKATPDTRETGSACAAAIRALKDQP